jgi:sialic acid synthase SpsE
MKTEIIAEIGQNHNGDMILAEKLIKAAADSGADAVKFQLYDARRLFSGKSENPWFDYNCETELSRKNVDHLHNICAKIGIEFLASVFDVERIEWLESLSVKRYKIASRSIKDTALIKGLINTNKPLVVSLGAWTASEFPKINTSASVEFLFCISKYPTPLNELELSKVDFKNYAGFSDHSLGISAACASFVRGARIVEKHFTLDKMAFGPDHQGSMTPAELMRLHEFRNDWALIK